MFTMSKLIIANWKSHKSPQEAESWMKVISTEKKQFSENVKVVVAPAFPLLPVVAEMAESAGVQLGAQDLSPFEAGAYTGAVSAHNLKGLSVKYALLGHSERRLYFNETHLDVARKVVQAVEHGLTPVVCVDSDFIYEQAAMIEDEYLEQCVVAYEPAGAIGTGNNEDVGKVRRNSKKIRDAFGDDINILYGGSVAPENIGEYMLVTDGALVGGASLDAEEFARLVQAVE